MSLISKPSNKYYLVLATSLVSFVFLFIQFFFHFVPDNFIGIPVQNIYSSIFLSFFLTASAFAAYLFNNNLKDKKVQKLLSYPLLFGLMLMPLAAIPFLIFKSGFSFPAEVLLAIEALAYLAIAGFALFTFFNMGNIFLKRSAPAASDIWKSIVIILATANIFNFFSLDYLHPVALGLYGFVGLLVLSQLFFFTGFKESSASEKGKIFLIFLCLTGIATIFFYLLLTYRQHFVFSGKHLLLFTLMGTCLLYTVYGFFAVLIAIPAGFISNKEQKLLKEIRYIHSNQGSDQRSVLKEIFRSCLKASGASGGAVIYAPTEASVAEQALDQQSIGDNDLKRVLFSIIYNKEHFLIYNETEHIYISHIKNHPILQHHDLPFESMLLFMVQVKHNAFAKILLFSNQREGFDKQQIEYASLLVQQAQLSFNNNMIFKDTLEAERFKKDMEIGKNLQKRLLPEYFPENNFFEVAAVSLAAEEVGGDYYDYHQFTDNSYAFIIADVSGKGTPAAFHVAEMKGIFQSLSLSKIAPAEFVKKANKAVSQCFDRGMFITLIHLNVDVNKKVIRYSRAGHCPVLFFNYKKGAIAYKEDDGLGLGILRNNSFNKMVSEQEISYDSGDIIVLYTDGLVEAKSKKLGEEYGFERLKDLVQINSIEKPESILKKVVRDVQEFAEFDLSRDDVSMVVIKMK